jgi:general secretion pathway protein D
MRLRIQAESSTLGPPQPPDGIPEEISRKVEAEVLLDDGETVVLGGLMKDGHRRSGAGVPLLRDLPVLGRLFGRSSRGHEGEELVIMVTPKLFDREPDG